jgi:hypothetical protein
MSIEFYKVAHEVPDNDVDVLIRTSGRTDPVEYAIAYMDHQGRWHPIGASCDCEGDIELDIEPYEWAHLPR